MKTKYILPIAIAILTLFNACVSVNEIRGTALFSGYDFTEYTKKGFLFTPEKYLGEYESIGLITLRITPTVRKTNAPSYTSDTLVYKSGMLLNRGEDFEIVETVGGRILVEVISSDKAIKLIYEKAVSMGADAIVNFNIEDIELHNGSLFYTGLRITGFAIKRIK